MTLKTFTLRRRISLSIAFMGLIGMMMAFATAELYKNIIFENEKEALAELVDLETSTILDEHTKKLEEFALRIQQNPAFKQAVKDLDTSVIQSLLNTEFYQYYITARVLIVNKLFVYNTDFSLISESSDVEEFNHSQMLCPEIVAKAKTRSGSARVKTLSMLCNNATHLFHSVIIPIGTLNPQGYIHVVSDPTQWLAKASQRLSMPLQIELPDSKVIYESDASRHGEQHDNFLQVQKRFFDHKGAVIATIVMTRNVAPLIKKLRTTRNIVMVLGGIITSLAIIMFLVFHNKSILTPLNALTAHLAKIRNDRSFLGTKINVRGTPELQSLAHDFNALSETLVDLYDTLERMAFTDQLTALPNRSRLQEQLAFYSKHGASFALFMMDLDRFKSVNDTLGHTAGDYLLQQVSERIGLALRKTDLLTRLDHNEHIESTHDTIARLGGDEFAAMLPTISNEKDAVFVAQKIQQEMQKPFLIQGCHFSIGISIGIAIFPQHGVDSELLMRHADVAMYHAKQNQLGHFIYDPKSDSHSVDLLTLESELRAAIQSDDLRLYFQPKVQLKSKKVIGFEALLRWAHPVRGNIPPDKFVAIAEQSDLINDLSRWVLSRAIEFQAAWAKQHHQISIAVNLSARNLLDSTLPLHIRSELTRCEVPPNFIFIELTETAVMADTARSLAALNLLKSIGLGLAIDDFGTGYSSLNYLKRLPVDEIKIDRSFVMDMETDPNDAIIVHSTIDLAHNMGLQVVAEGVENPRILEMLTERGCDIAQGYYIAKPMPAESVIAWLENHIAGEEKPVSR